MGIHTYSLILSYDNGGQFSQNVLHYQFEDSGYTDTQSAALALINAWDTANRTKLRNMLPLLTKLVSIKARGLTAPGGFEAIKLISSTNGGLRTGNQGTAAVGPCIILFPTANAKPRGRCFLPGVSDDDLIDGDFTSTYKAVVVTNATLFTASIVLAGGGTPTAAPVIYSRKTTPGTAYAIEYARLSPMAGTQRRRQRPH